jgi:hypothetical protein
VSANTSGGHASNSSVKAPPLIAHQVEASVGGSAPASLCRASPAITLIRAPGTSSVDALRPNFSYWAGQAIGDARSSTPRVDRCAASASWVAAHVAGRRIASCNAVPDSTE